MSVVKLKQIRLIRKLHWYFSAVLEQQFQHIYVCFDKLSTLASYINRSKFTSEMLILDWVPNYQKIKLNKSESENLTKFLAPNFYSRWVCVTLKIYDYFKRNSVYCESNSYFLWVKSMCMVSSSLVKYSDIVPPHNPLIKVAIKSWLVP